MLTPGSLVHYKKYVKNPAFNQQRSVTADNTPYIWQDAGQGYFHSLHPVSTHDDYSILAVIETEDQRLISFPIEHLTIANPATQVQANNKKLLDHINLCRKLLQDLYAGFDIAKDHGMESPFYSRIKKVLEEISK